MKKPTRPRDKQHKRAVAIFAVLVFGHVLMGALVIYFISASHIRTLLSDVVARAQEDIIYSNGRWDTSRYDTDPEIPGSYRLYVITKDGFVIDRWRPIAGYLDTSDYKRLSAYTSPQTVSTVSGLDWRLFSVLLRNSTGQPVGVIVVGMLAPKSYETAEVDSDLKLAAEKLTDIVKVTDTGLDTSNVNSRDLPHNVSFEVVDQFNKLHVKSNNSNGVDRLPDYIDPSYIVSSLTETSFRQVTDEKQNELFLVRSEPILDEVGQPVGAVIVARTISSYRDLLRVYVAVGLTTGLTATYLFSLASRRWLASKDGKLVPISAPLKLADIRTVTFNKVDHCLEVNTRKVFLTPGTNQYGMCMAMLNSPRKKWAADELLDRIGEDIVRDGWRKLYDAMNSVNKKTALAMEPKLITNTNKTYRINPDLASKITKVGGKPQDLSH